MLLLAGLQFLICGIVAMINIPEIMNSALQNIPPFMRALIEQQFFGGLTQKGLLAFGWNHPIALAIGTAVAIVFASRAVAGEIESGAMELLLSQPISRLNYFTGHVLFALTSIALLSLIGVGGTLIGIHVYSLAPIEGIILFKVAFNFFLLHSAWYGITLLFSVFGREAGRVAFIGFLLALVSYFVQVIAQLWTKAAFLLPYTVHTYYSPQKIFVNGELKPISVIVLVGLIVASICIAGWRFRKRDIP
jgi:ABC-type transport system involved in multi-copper enzyme maturation permease subunit